MADNEALITSEAVNTAFAKLGELASKYGPPAIDTAAMVVQVNGAGSVMLGVALAVGSALAWHVSVKTLKAVEDCDDAPRILGGLFVGCAAMGATVGAATNLLNVWNWVALFNPKLALAAKLVNALPGM